MRLQRLPESTSIRIGERPLVLLIKKTISIAAKPKTKDISIVHELVLKKQNRQYSAKSGTGRNTNNLGANERISENAHGAPRHK